MKILVTGATSGLGRNAVQHLLETGIQVIATGRNTDEGLRLTEAGARFIPLDLTQASVEACASIMRDCDAVWHCAAKSSPWGDKASFYQANVTATHTLAEAAGNTGIARFIHISTPAVYFDFQHHYHLKENYLARRFSSHYASTKHQAEQVVSAAARRFTHTTFVMLRPRGLFGPHDNTIVPRLLRQLRRDGGALHLPRGGAALLDLTYVQNVVHAMMLATHHPTLPTGSLYNITNHQPMRLADMLEGLLGQQLNLNYRIKNIPWGLLSLAARGMELAGKYTHREPPLTRYSAGTVCFDMTLCPEKAINELGYRPQISMEEGILLTGEWLRAHGKNS